MIPVKEKISGRIFFLMEKLHIKTKNSFANITNERKKRGCHNVACYYSHYDLSDTQCCQLIGVR